MRSAAHDAGERDAGAIRVPLPAIYGSVPCSALSRFDRISSRMLRNA